MISGSTFINCSAAFGSAIYVSVNRNARWWSVWSTEADLRSGISLYEFFLPIDITGTDFVNNTAKYKGAVYLGNARAEVYSR